MKTSFECYFQYFQIIKSIRNPLQLHRCSGTQGQLHIADAGILSYQSVRFLVTKGCGIDSEMITVEYKAIQIFRSPVPNAITLMFELSQRKLN